jgi:hypothetical protein
MSITYCGCVFVVLVIQHAMGMPRPIFLFMVFLAVPCFPAYLINGTDCRKKLLNTNLVFSTFCLKKLIILRRTQRDTIITVHRSSREVKVKVKQFRYKPRVAQRVPGS